MCRSAAEGGRRCSGSCGAASARQRQQRSRARRALEAAQAAGDPDAIAQAEAKYTAVTGHTPPAPTAGTDSGSITGELTMPPTPHEPTEAQPTPAAPPKSTEQRVRDVYKALSVKKQDWIRLARIREALGDDVDQAEVTRVLKTMIRGGTVHLAPDSNRKVLTQADHDAAVQMSGEAYHLLAIEPAGAADHVRDIGLTNATDEELEEATYASECGDAFYDEIRAEMRRRRQT